jgi:hypothetical protein
VSEFKVVGGEGNNGAGAASVFGCGGGGEAAAAWNPRVDRFVGGRAVVMNEGVPFGFKFPGENVEAR